MRVSAVFLARAGGVILSLQPYAAVNRRFALRVVVRLRAKLNGPDVPFHLAFLRRSAAQSRPEPASYPTPIMFSNTDHGETHSFVAKKSCPDCDFLLPSCE